MNGIIDDAVKAGKVSPKERERWEKIYEQDPQWVVDTLERLTPIPNRGQDLSEDDLEAARLAGMSAAEYQEAMQREDE